MKFDKDVTEEKYLKKVKEIANECYMSYDDVLQLYYEKYYELKSRYPKKHSGYWAVHAINAVKRFVSKNPQIYFGALDAKLGFRIQKRLKDDFEKECTQAGILPSDMLRELVEKWVKNKLSGWDITS